MKFLRRVEAHAGLSSVAVVVDQSDKSPVDFSLNLSDI
jgi:hypothetical protein